MTTLSSFPSPKLATVLLSLTSSHSLPHYNQAFAKPQHFLCSVSMFCPFFPFPTAKMLPTCALLMSCHCKMFLFGFPFSQLPSSSSKHHCQAFLQCPSPLSRDYALVSTLSLERPFQSWVSPCHCSYLCHHHLLRSFKTSLNSYFVSFFPSQCHALYMLIHFYMPPCMFVVNRQMLKAPLLCFLTRLGNPVRPQKHSASNHWASLGFYLYCLAPTSAFPIWGRLSVTSLPGFHLSTCTTDTDILGLALCRCKDLLKINRFQGFVGLLWSCLTSCII